VIDFKELFGVIDNRSVPTNVLLPHIAYRDLAGAVAWLKSAFGFEEYYRYGSPGTPDGVMIRRGCAYIMLKAVRAGSLPPQTSLVTIFVDDVDAHYAKAKSAGAKIIEDLNETCYGERQYGVEDLEGHRWLFSQHVRDTDPAEWGAVVAGS
jgi:uncharacterized glyoxalase superfamily protein PhnB